MLPLGRLFLQGISTRKLRGIAQELFGQGVSATTISRTATYLDEELRHYQTRPLADDFAFLFLDGITQKVRELGVEKKVTLCALVSRRMGLRGCSPSIWWIRRTPIAGGPSR